MREFITNSNTLHFLIQKLGLVFKVEDHKPYRLVNYQNDMAFFPCDETIKGSKILMMYHKDYIMPFAYLPRWKTITSENTDKNDITDIVKLFADLNYGR